MSEFGHEDTLLSEFDEKDIIGGGYLELSRFATVLTMLRAEYNNEDPEDHGLQITEDTTPPFNPQEEAPSDHH